MHTPTRPRILFVLAALICAAETTNTQTQPVAQIGHATPLPVFVTNDGYYLLPQGFVRGSRWRFTSWTSPSTTSWIGQVEATSGPWANLTIRAHDGTVTTRWYNVMAMPGGWEKQ